MNLKHYWHWNHSRGEPPDRNRFFQCSICGVQHKENVMEEFGSTLPSEECATLKMIVNRPVEDRCQHLELGERYIGG